MGKKVVNKLGGGGFVGEEKPEAFFLQYQQGIPVLLDYWEQRIRDRIEKENRIEREKIQEVKKVVQRLNL